MQASAIGKHGRAQKLSHRGGGYVWWIAAVMLIGGATALSLAGGEKYAPAEQGTVTLSRSF